MPSEYRVVFTGHTGLEKSQILGRLKKWICDHDDEWLRATQVSDTQAELVADRLVGIFDAEKILKDNKDEFDDFLESHGPKAKREVWRNSFLGAIEEWKSTNPTPKFSFLSLHVTWQVNSQFFSPVNWRHPLRTAVGEVISEFEDTFLDGLKEFDPHLFVH